MKTERAERRRAERPATTAPARRVVIPTPANENRAPLGLRAARWGILVSSVAIAIWLLRSLL